MYRKIIIGFDGSDSGDEALLLGKALAEATGAEAIVTGIFPSGPFVAREAETQFGAKVKAAAEEIGAGAEAFPSGSPAHGLHDAAEELGADLIVVGSAHGTEAGHMSAGNVGVQLLHGSPCAVAVASSGRHDQGPGLKRIGVAIDGSDESDEALRAGIALATAAGATLNLMTVGVQEASAFGWGYGVFDLDQDMQAVLGQRLDASARGIPSELRVRTTVLTKGSVPELLRHASEELDLLCLGSRAYGPARRLLWDRSRPSSLPTTRAPCWSSPAAWRPRTSAQTTSWQRRPELLGGHQLGRQPDVEKRLDVLPTSSTGLSVRTTT